jgi:hypothetical protein
LQIPLAGANSDFIIYKALDTDTAFYINTAYVSDTARASQNDVAETYIYMVEYSYDDGLKGTVVQQAKLTVKIKADCTIETLTLPVTPVPYIADVPWTFTKLTTSKAEVSSLGAYISSKPTHCTIVYWLLYKKAPFNWVKHNDGSPDAIFIDLVTFSRTNNKLIV